MFKSIRHRLFAALAGFTVLVCIGYTALALVIAYVTEDMLVDKLLAREASTVAAHFTLKQEVRAPANPLITVYQNATEAPPPVRARIAAGERRGEIFTATGQHYHLRTLELGGVPVRRVYLVADVAPLLVVSNVIDEVGGLLLLVALGLIALALLLAWMLSRKLVLPLQVLAAEVRQLAPGDPVVLSAAGRSDEIGYLADKLTAAIADLHGALAREHDFTRDVSHELRTPLTVMRNALGDGATTPLAGAAVAQLRAGVADMGGTIDVLFALARAEQLPGSAFDLRGCIENSLLGRLEADKNWAANGEQTRSWLSIDLPDRLPVRGNVQLTMLLLNNCLDNALFHGGPDCQLRIARVADAVRITNSIDSDRPAAVHGFLHGQDLLRRIAATMGWQIAFQAGAGAYSVDIVPLTE
jgi:signal transduction histidine kinase